MKTPSRRPHWLPDIVASIEALVARDRILADRRTFAFPQATLDELGQMWGISRERVRQLEDRLVRRFPAPDVATVDAILFRLRRNRKTPLYVRELPGLAPWLTGVDQHVGILAGALRSLGGDHRVVDSEEGPYVTHCHAEVTKVVLKLCRSALREHDAPDSAARERHLLKVLSDMDVPELLPIVKTALMTARPSANVERIEDLLRKAGRPVSLADLYSQMKPISMVNMQYALGQADVVREGTGVYVLRETLAKWSHLLPTVRASVLRLCKAHPERQWLTRDLLKAAIDAGTGWAETMPMHALEHLLHDVAELRFLKWSSWGLASAHPQRLHVLDLAVRVLRRAKKPMRSRDLLAAIREWRDIGPRWRPRYPVVALGDGLVGLAERDLGITPSIWDSWRQAIEAKLLAGKALDTAKLAESLVAVGGPKVSNSVLQGILRGEQSLSRRVRSNAKRINE